MNAFFYDRSERAVQISGPALGTMNYDAHGRRVRQILNGEIIYSVYGLDGALLFRDNATTGETTDFIAMGGHTVGRFDETGAFTYIHSDHLGSASAATDAAGNILWTESYTPFGEIRHDPAANRDETGYTGHIRDAASGLVYAQARFYHPALGRFLSPDPVGFADMGPGYFQRYGYSFNDPVNYTDPTGEAGVAVAGCFNPVGAAICGGAVAIGGAYYVWNHTDWGRNRQRELGQGLTDLGDRLFNEGADRGEALGEDGRLSQDDTGKVHGNLPDADQIPDDGVEESIEALGGSIGVREAEQERFPNGDPNGSRRERRQAQQRERHEERIRRERELLEGLRKRS